MQNRLDPLDIDMGVMPIEQFGAICARNGHDGLCASGVRLAPVSDVPYVLVDNGPSRTL